MGDKTRGLYDKFEVRRTDGKSEPGEKHHGCQYFVLDLDHDPHARPALAAYMASCQAEYPLLAADIRTKLSTWRAPEVCENYTRSAIHPDWCGHCGYHYKKHGPV
jgi:hypothetical protein